MKVNEIFSSLQGEGLWAGTPMTFIRLSGCNLQCPFCDTQHETFTEMSYDEILQEVQKEKIPRVCITGGEPFTHSGLSELADRIQRARLRVHIETNGTIRKLISADWITCSPKPDSKRSLWHSYVDEYKILVSPEGPITAIPDGPQPVFLQPVDLGPFQDGDGWFTPRYLGRIAGSLSKIYEIQRQRPELRLGLQLHKLLGRR